MIIGIPKEIKHFENRVSIVPANVATLVSDGHQVLVEASAGAGSHFADEDYVKAGACIVSREEVYTKCEMLCKVKEIEPSEYDLLYPGQIVFSYLHSNAHPEMTRFLLDHNITGICYEDVDDDEGKFPLLAPMSTFAGKGGFLAALHLSQSIQGGSGKILCRIPGLETPHITILGAGFAGMGAAELASAFGNQVTILDIDLKALKHAQELLPSNVELLISNRTNLVNCLKKTDVFMNCILWPKTRKDHLVYRTDLGLMKKSALIIDVSCDDEGAIETSHSTTHADSTYVVDGICHYAVDNIPSAFAASASELLSLNTFPYIRKVANLGFKQAMLKDAHLRRGLTTYKGKLTLEETALKQGLPFSDPLDAIQD